MKILLTVVFLFAGCATTHLEQRWNSRTAKYDVVEVKDYVGPGEFFTGIVAAPFILLNGGLPGMER